MHIGSGVIVVSNILQAIGGFWPALSISECSRCNCNTISISATFIQAQKSATESQQQFDKERAERKQGDIDTWLDSQPGYIQASFKHMQQPLEQQKEI